MAGLTVIRSEVSGIELVSKRLDLARARTAEGTERGRLKAGLELQRLSQALVPIDTGNLRGSAFTNKAGRGFDAVVTVGYTADYAIYVHEDLDAHHAPGRIAKYLEKPARDNMDRLLKIIRDEGSGAIEGKSGGGSAPPVTPSAQATHQALHAIAGASKVGGGAALVRAGQAARLLGVGLHIAGLAGEVVDMALGFLAQLESRRKGGRR